MEIPLNEMGDVSYGMKEKTKQKKTASLVLIYFIKVAETQLLLLFLWNNIKKDAQGLLHIKKQFLYLFIFNLDISSHDVV